MPKIDDLDTYLATINRIEPNIGPIDAAAFYSSTAISLRRIADAAEAIAGALVVIVARMQDDADEDDAEDDDKAAPGTP